MITNNELVDLLEKYGIDGKKMIKNNPNVLMYGDYDNIEKIIIFLQSIGISAKNIEKCPSILTMRTAKEIEDNYNFLVNETELEHIDIEDCLSILSDETYELKNIYGYVVDKYGLETLKSCPSILTGKFQNIVGITDTLEKTIGLDIVRNNGLNMHVSNPTLIFRLTANELLAKINYLKVNNMPLDYETSNGKLKINSIFGMSNKNMQKTYGISKKELVRDYLVINDSYSK